MSSDPQRDQQPFESRPSVGAELVIPVLAVAFTVYYATTIWDSPWTAQATAAVVGVVLLVCCVLFFIRAGIDIASGRARLGFETLMEPIASLPRKSALFVLTVVALVVMPWIGFTLTSILFLALSILMLREGRNVVAVTLFSVVLSIFWFVIFVVLFERRFPLGWLDHQLKALFVPLLKLVGIE